jgi:ATP-dependent RNA helicase RhlE
MERVAIPSITIHGEKDQGERLEAMRKFKDGECQILIATDVSARGIDIPDINYVINYDLPEKVENYVHRVGRTGRGVNKGIALSFCSEDEKELLGEIQQFLNKEIEVIKIGKKDYASTMEIARKNTDTDVQALIADHEAWLKAKKRKHAGKKYGDNVA